ncbi:putative transporter MCH1 [Candida viswanathii]|uniref:Probable transporter MCH1 n=1 Tax=Candida viswanathii TaxID=5486 RepID=A0A367YFL3_9ASCO|nr:putative transporter MCH1 [Candida viswanathii]
MHRHLHHVSHSIKKYLSQHIALENLKKLAFIFSLLSCLVAGSILLFTLYTASFHDLLGLSYLQINSIASLSALGMYFCLPVLGYLADSYGPALLSLFLIWFFCPSYFVNSYLVSMKVTSIYGYCITFCCIGLATSSLYFSSLITCARIYPDHKGLAISLPITCYGLSALIGAQLLKLQCFHKDGYLDLKWFPAGVVVQYRGPEDVESTDEELPLLELTPSRSLEPPNHHQRFIRFLKDPSAWILLVSLVLNIGPMESYQNNLSSILKHSNHADLSNQVSIMAASSTAARLVLGVLSDYLAKYICRVWLLLFIIVVGIAGQLTETSAILNGASYGGMFTLYPTIVASIWGIDIMGPHGGRSWWPRNRFSFVFNGVWQECRLVCYVLVEVLLLDVFRTRLQLYISSYILEVMVQTRVKKF